MSNAGLETIIRQAAAKKLIYSGHAVVQMASPQRRIRRSEVKQVVGSGTIIEDYPNDDRGHSCLVLGYGDNGRPIHVVCAPKAGQLVIVTAYLPDPQKWDIDFKRRR